MTYSNFLKHAPKACEGCHPTVMEKRMSTSDVTKSGT